MRRKTSKRGNAVCALALAISLASCAPTLRAPSGEPLHVVAGQAYAQANRVPLEELSAATPDAGYVTFRTCQGAAVLAADVRQYGPEMTLSACQQAADHQQMRPLMLTMAGGSLVTLGFLLFQQWLVGHPH